MSWLFSESMMLKHDLFERINVNVSERTKYIFVLGSSIIAASELKTEKIATSILQKRIGHEYSQTQVLNLGYSEYDLNDLFLRVNYFSRSYSPDKVILVLYYSNVKSLNRKDLLSTLRIRNFGSEKKGLIFKIKVFLRNNLSFSCIADFEI